MNQPPAPFPPPGSDASPDVRVAGSPAAGGPGGPSGGVPRRRVMGFAAVGVLLALVVALVAVLLGPDGALRETDTATPVSPPVTEPVDPAPTEPPDTTEPPPPAPEPEDPFQATIDELMAFVEQERGLPFLERPEVVVLEDAAFVERLQTLQRESFEEDPERIANFTGIYQALGLLPSGVTLEEAFSSFGEGAVLGFYDTRSGELAVRGGEMTPLRRVVILHELVHALDDQHFELYRPEYDDRTDEISFGFTSLVEGSARWVENRYRATLSSDEQRAVLREEMALGAGVDLSNLTMAFVRIQLLPYDAGEALVGVLLDRGGRDALDAAFEDPPVTSAQVLEPELFLVREPAVPVAPPPADGEVLEEGLFGRAVLQVLLVDALGTRGRGVDRGGLGGDWFVSWAAGDETCVRVDVVMDGAGSAGALERGLGVWLRGGPGQVRVEGEVARTDETTVRMTTCA